MKLSRLFLLLLIFGVMTPNLQAQVTFDETVDGELSDDNLAPTDLLVFEIGLNTVAGTVVDATGANPNVDIFTFEVAAGTQFDGLFVNVFDSTDDLAFLGLNDSDTFPFDIAGVNSGPDQNLFIGGLLYGTADVGNDILADVGDGGIGTGFTGPLQAGDYTVYLQQLGGATVDYELGFNVSAVPEPGSAVALMLLGFAGLARRKR